MINRPRQPEKYEPMPEFDEQNFAVRRLKDWQLVRKFFGRSQKSVNEIIDLQEASGEEDQTPQFED